MKILFPKFAFESHNFTRKHKTKSNLIVLLKIVREKKKIIKTTFFLICSHA